jgi:hypothetical protein
MVRPAWDNLPTPAQREILKLLFDDIRFGSPVVRLTRWSTPTDRLEAAHQRTTITPRRPGKAGKRHAAATAPRRSGGARAQRRESTAIELPQQVTPVDQEAAPVARAGRARPTATTARRRSASGAGAAG